MRKITKIIVRVLSVAAFISMIILVFLGILNISGARQCFIFFLYGFGCFLIYKLLNFTLKCISNDGYFLLLLKSFVNFKYFLWGKRLILLLVGEALIAGGVVLFFSSYKNFIIVHIFVGIALFVLGLATISRMKFYCKSCGKKLKNLSCEHSGATSSLSFSNNISGEILKNGYKTYTCPECCNEMRISDNFLILNLHKK